MTLRLHARSSRNRAITPVTMAVLLALVLVVAGCGDKKGDKPASQTAAKVNKEEITVHQINFVLQQQRGLAPEQTASAGKQVLERLVDQELAIQKAQELKLDREPKVVQQLEAARRDVIARAYLEKVAAAVTKPGLAETKGYYDAHPALFKERRVYDLQELSIQAAPDQIAALKAKLASAKDLPDFVNYLKTNDFKFTANQAVRAAEQLPLSSLDRFAQMKDGQSIFNASPSGAQIVFLAGSRSQPVDEAKATHAIEQFLFNERKRKMAEDDLKTLRGAAKIEYLGDYAKGGAGDDKPSAAAALQVSPSVPVAAPANQNVASEPAAK